jgi:hypothetical protein
LATELEQLESLERANILDDKQKARLVELRKAGNAADNTDDDMEQLGTVTDIDRFNSAGEYALVKAGFMKSAIVSIQEPQTKTSQRWLIAESEEAFKTKSGTMRKNRGVIIMTFDAGVGITRGILEGLDIPFSLDEATGILRWRKPNIPYPFYGDWQADPRAIGQVKITGLKTEAIGAQIKQTV